MRILHLESGLDSGGQEYRTLAEVQWLNAAGHPAWIACHPESEIFQQSLAAKVPVIPLKMGSNLSPLTTGRLYQIVKKFDCDLIHAHSPKDAWLAAPLRLLKAKIVRSRHISSPVKPNFIKTFCYRYGCDHLIPTAEVIRKSFFENNRIPLQHMTVVGEGVDLTQFHPGVDGSFYRQLWGAQSQDVVFGCVGMLRPEKGQKIFIQAAALVRQEIAHARFVIIGDHKKVGSPTPLQYRNLVREKFGFDVWRPGRSVCLSQEVPILMHGHEPDIAQATAALDVVVVPSLMEAQSRTAPEALCLGKPVIASKVGGLPEVIENEKTGLLVPPKNAEALAEAMMRLATDSVLCKRLGAAAAEAGKKRFSLNARMRETLEVYKKILRRNTK